MDNKEILKVKREHYLKVGNFESYDDCFDDSEILELMEAANINQSKLILEELKPLEGTNHYLDKAIKKIKEM